MIVLDPDRIASLREDELDALASSRECVVAIAAGRTCGLGAAALMLADYAAIDERGSVIVDSPVVWAGVAWRLGGRALQLTVGKWMFPSGDCSPALSVSAPAARDHGLVDEVVSGDWRAWLDGWLAHRSAVASDAAALLTGHRGGDALERAEFARLFATGEPRRGMDAFLSKRRPQFRGWR